MINFRYVRLLIFILCLFLLSMFLYFIICPGVAHFVKLLPDFFVSIYKILKFNVLYILTFLTCFDLFDLIIVNNTNLRFIPFSELMSLGYRSNFYIDNSFIFKMEYVYDYIYNPKNLWGKISVWYPMDLFRNDWFSILHLKYIDFYRWSREWRYYHMSVYFNIHSNMNINRYHRTGIPMLRVRYYSKMWYAVWRIVKLRTRYWKFQWVHRYFTQSFQWSIGRNMNRPNQRLSYYFIVNPAIVFSNSWKFLLNINVLYKILLLVVKFLYKILLHVSVFPVVLFVFFLTCLIRFWFIIRYIYTLRIKLRHILWHKTILYYLSYFIICSVIYISVSFEVFVLICCMFVCLFYCYSVNYRLSSLFRSSVLFDYVGITNLFVSGVGILYRYLLTFFFILRMNFLSLILRHFYLFDNWLFIVLFLYSFVNFPYIIFISVLVFFWSEIQFLYRNVWNFLMLRYIKPFLIPFVLDHVYFYASLWKSFQKKYEIYLEFISYPQEFFFPIHHNLRRHPVIYSWPYYKVLMYKLNLPYNPEVYTSYFAPSMLRGSKGGLWVRSFSTELPKIFMYENKDTLRHLYLSDYWKNFIWEPSSDYVLQLLNEPSYLDFKKRRFWGRFFAGIRAVYGLLTDKDHLSAEVTHYEFVRDVMIMFYYSSLDFRLYEWPSYIRFFTFPIYPYMREKFYLLKQYVWLQVKPFRAWFFEYRFYRNDFLLLPYLKIVTFYKLSGYRVINMYSKQRNSCFENLVNREDRDFAYEYRYNWLLAVRLFDYSSYGYYVFNSSVLKTWLAFIMSFAFFIAGLHSMLYGRVQLIYILLLFLSMFYDFWFWDDWVMRLFMLLIC